jgi:hypothetical protein
MRIWRQATGVARIRLQADETGRAPALGVGVVERSCLLAHAGLGVGEKNRLIMASHDNLVFKPDTGNERRARCVVLHIRLVEVQVPDAVARLNFVNR